ncbi:hypothetical protein FRX31_034259 [Thalictrum thalictroides]|uniref:Uncharacterized protein n=1 Tax=Thalictrum thalictroides TaxID=46969 RepID=A0A7J6UVC3_THATH|nr:hypothetical protein FRX31_034259 [Thalictrum thalictroides]
MNNGEYNQIIKQQTKHWRQKATIDWYRFGDTDSKFLFNMVMQRRQQNTIYIIKDDNGEFLQKLLGKDVFIFSKTL